MILIFFALCTLFFLIHQYLWRRRGLPPGPTPIPIFGNLFQLSGSEAPGISIFQKWKDQYGPIFTFYMGPVPFVVLTDYQDIKETVIKDGDTYADKYLSPEFNKYFRGGEYGIMDISGDRWKEHRKFAVLQLRELGVGKPLMESKILIEAEELIKKLKTAEILNEDFLLQSELDVAVGSVINQFLFGYRFDRSKLFEFTRIKTLVNNFMEEVGKPLGVLAFTCHGIPSFLVKLMVSGIEEQKRELFRFLRKQIDGAKSQINYEEEHNEDFVEAYLRKKFQREQKNDFDSYCDSQLENVCFDIWAAGFDTLTNTVGFLIAYAINYPEMQMLIHQEIDNYLAHHSRLLTLADKNALVYFNAFANEAQRVSNILPMNLPHALTRDVKLKGYHLKKGTGVIHQIANVMTDETIFKDSQRFDPNRFIDENGKLKKIEELCPFSMGKRQCIGEGLARMEIFLLAANLFNYFEFLPASDGLPSLYKDFSLVSHVIPYKCRQYIP
ncbi:CYtochrome P450 family [Caenorhabditis elegans]|uniref:CYtochrome P450 family n=1 Tax=Caenorhabditis elegans TaxID=6239 RepID=Q27471_CAEEL|nr:CYtochrome P450 family [Caenorhabditis elegans]CCD65646.1 CYtochrome P450 family [Caenorhabditis elegans]|eukprot:NP_505342.2 CYtochrome P450 family [Caenorhabditis elegans]